MKKLGQFLTNEDTFTLEPFDSWDKNFLFWLKKWIINKLDTLSSRLVDDIDLFSNIKLLFENSKDIEEAKSHINHMARLGNKGIKSYFDAVYRLYYFMLFMEAESLKDISSKSIMVFLEHYMYNANIDIKTGEFLFEKNNNEEIKEKLSYDSQKNIYVRIKNFISYIENHNLMINEGEGYSFEIKTIIKPKRTDTLKNIDILSPDKEYMQFLLQIDKMSFKSNDIMHKLILKILLLSASRVSEITSLKWEDIEETKTYLALTLIGKGNRSRTVYVHKKQLGSLWKQYKAKEQRKGNPLVFVNSLGKPVDRRIIAYKVEAVLKALKIHTTKKSCHLLRHSTASYMYYHKIHKLEEIQKLLGHKTITTTEIYTHIADGYTKTTAKDLSSLIDKEMPKKRF